MKPARKSLSKRLGSALVMTLVIIVLITVVTVGYLASVMLETKTAGASLDQERAYGIAMVGAHQAMAKIREALGPWDDPYKNFATSNPPILLVAFARPHHTLVVFEREPADQYRALLGICRDQPRESEPPAHRRIVSNHRRGDPACSAGQMGELAARSHSTREYQ